MISKNGSKMSMRRKERRRLPRPLRPIEPETPLERRPLDRPWPVPTPGVPLPIREDEDIGKILKQSLDKLVEIEKRLERIEKLLTPR